MANLAPRYFLRAYYVNTAQAEFAFSRDFSTGAIQNPTKDKIQALLPPEGNIQTVRPETGESTIGRMVLRLVDLGGEITRYIAAAELTLATALSAGGGETEVVFNETPDGLPAKGTLEIENERIRYTARDDALKKVTGITRAVDSTSLAAHGTGTLVRNGEQLRPGNRVQLFEGSETTDETSYNSYTVMDIVTRTRPGSEPLIMLEAQDVQRFTRRTVFLTATPALPVTRSGNPMTLLKNFYTTDVGIPSVRVDTAGLDNLANEADFTGQVYEFLIKEPQDAREWARLLHRATATWPFVKRDGKIGAKKIRLPTAGPFPTLTEANIVGVPQWFATDDRIINQVVVRYDWDLADLPGSFRVVDTFEDVASRDRLGIQTSIIIDTRGIKTTQSGGTIAQKVAKRIFDRYRLPTEGFVCRVFFSALRDFDIGDFVDFTHSRVENLKTGKRGITNAVCEVLDIRPVFGIGGPDQPPHLIVTLINTGVLTSAANPSPTSIILDHVAPAAVAGLTLVSGGSLVFTNNDGTINARIKASWTAVTDTLVTRPGGKILCQIKKTADSIYNTQVLVQGGETEAFFDNLKVGTAYDVRISAINIHGVQGAFSTVSNHTVLGKSDRPADVTGFSAQQNGNVVNFRWDQVANEDLAGYEIRFAKRGIGATFADAAAVTKVTRGTVITNATIPPGDWTFFVKAVNTSGLDSATAAAFNLIVISDLDIIVQKLQEHDWLGTKTNFVRHQITTDYQGTLRGILIPKSQDLASGNNFNVFNNFVLNPFATCTYEAPEIDIDFDDTVRAWAEVNAALGPGVGSGLANPSLELDYRKAAGAYDGFEPWSIGTAEGRFFKFRIVLTTALGLAKITGFKPTVDLLERSEGATGIVVGASGLAIVFARRFHEVPRIQVTPSAASARIPTHALESATGFTAHVYDAAGTEVGATVDWEARGA
jgi:hypothetical protein